MSEVTIDPEIIKRTQESIGKFIKKPVLTEKLLRKPPFRFLHDIFCAVIRDTECFAGLYTAEELNYDNITDRDAKMRFLKKMIDTIKLTTEMPLSVKSSKIVAGLEPEKTNELLQLMGLVIEKNLDWVPAVQAITQFSNTVVTKKKSKEERTTKEKGKEFLEKSPPKDEKHQKHGLKLKSKSDMADVNKVNINKDAQKPQKKSSDPVIKEKKKHKSEKQREKSSTKEAANKSSPEKEIPVQTNKSPEKTADVKVKRKREHSVILSNPNSNCEHSPDIPKIEDNFRASTINDIEHEIFTGNTLVKITGSNQDAEGSPTAVSVEHTAMESSNHPTTPKLEDKQTLSTDKLNSVNEKDDKEKSFHSNESKSSVEEVAQDSAMRTERQTIEKTEIVSAFKPDVASNSQSPPRPRTSLRPPSVRPASARPGAPRRRDKNVEIILQPNEQIKMSGISVKLETFISKLEDDDEDLVVIDNANTDESFNEKSNEPNMITEEESAQKGHLVQQILETQKEFMQGDTPDLVPNVDKINDRLKINSRQSSARQMNTLRDAIQNLTKSVNPLGKLMDFVPEDIDAMQLELTMWRDTYTQSSAELKKERSLTDSVTEPLKNQLTTIETTIKEYQEMIDACRAKILQNAEKIQKLLST